MTDQILAICGGTYYIENVIFLCSSSGTVVISSKFSLTPHEMSLKDIGHFVSSRIIILFKLPILFAIKNLISFKNFNKFQKRFNIIETNSQANE